MTHQRIKVLLADDHPALRMGLRILLDRHPRISVIGEVGDGESALRFVCDHKPDVVVLDCQLPILDGVAVANYLKKRDTLVRVIALSAYDDDRYLAGMANAGAAGYILKSEAPAEVVQAVLSVHEGTILWTDEQRRRVQRWQSNVADILASLTEREVEVLELLVRGLSNKEIAQQLSITVRTTDFHVSNILRKLGVISRVEAVVWSQQHLTTT